MGLLGALVMHAQQLTNHFKENVLVMVYFSKQAPDAEIEHACNKLSEKEYVKKSVFISKEEAAYTFKEELGEDFVEIIGDNPLPSSMELYLNADKVGEKIEMVLDEIKEIPFVYEVEYEQNLIKQIDQNKKILGLGLLVLSLLLVVISVVLINNTVRLSVYSRRFLVKSMQLVGATEWFIIKPFVLRSLLVGIAGAFLAWLLTFGLVHMAYGFITGDFIGEGVSNLPDRFTLINIRDYSLLFVALLVLGILIVLPSTFVSTKKYLGSKIEDLY
jgi:cell division transport system permease protein